MSRWSWKQWELVLLVIYAASFYAVVIYRSLQLSEAHYGLLPRLQPGWLWNRLNDASDSQWRNFRGNLFVLSVVLGFFVLVASASRSYFQLKGKGMSIVWLLLSFSYLSYLHGAWYTFSYLEYCLILNVIADLFSLIYIHCSVIFILVIASANYFLVKGFSQSKYFSHIIWSFNIAVLLSSRIYEGYAFSSIGQSLAFLDSYRGTFRWQICFNLVILRMISFGFDYHWACVNSHYDHKDKSINIDGYSFTTYLSYLLYAPLYISGPIISFNSFASQLNSPQRSYSLPQVGWYGFRWIFCLLLLEFMTHFFYYNSFATSGLWRRLSPLDIFIIGYGVLNFMWLKFLLIWRFFRLWSLLGGIEAPENMPRCINNCHDLESFWKSWHASFNKWLVRYVYIPLGGSPRKLLNVWVIFTFVAIWHDLEWKLLSWAWLTCLFMIPEMAVKSIMNLFKETNSAGRFILREVHAVAGAVTITCLMVTNLAGYVIGPQNINWLISRLLLKDGLAVVSFIFTSFYVGTKLMLHIRDAKNPRRNQPI